MCDIETVDRAFGLSNEERMINTMSLILKTKLTKISDKWSTFDAKNHDSSVFVEIKTRRCKSTDFDTTIVGINKIREARRQYKLGNKVYFVFSFSDDNYYWEYTEEPNHYEVRCGGRGDRGSGEWKTYAYIYTDKLRIIM